MLGILIPYQIKLRNLEKEFYVDGQQYTNFIYLSDDNRIISRLKYL